MGSEREARQETIHPAALTPMFSVVYVVRSLLVLACCIPTLLITVISMPKVSTSNTTFPSLTLTNASSRIGPKKTKLRLPDSRSAGTSKSCVYG